MVQIDNRIGRNLGFQLTNLLCTFCFSIQTAGCCSAWIKFVIINEASMPPSLLKLLIFPYVLQDQLIYFLVIISN